MFPIVDHARQFQGLALYRDELHSRLSTHIKVIVISSRGCGDIAPTCTINFILFVCFFTCSLRAETHLGPDGTRLEQNAGTHIASIAKYVFTRWKLVAPLLRSLPFLLQPVSSFFSIPIAIFG